MNWTGPYATPTVPDESEVGPVTLKGVVTVTLAVPFTPVLEAVTVKGPPVVVALNNPELLIVPPPFTAHVNVGCVVIGLPNWSRPVALNCLVPPTDTVALDGETVMLVRTCAVAQDGNLKEAMRVLQLKLPVVFSYSLV